MKKSLIGLITIVMTLSATSVLAQQKTMEGMENMKPMPTKPAPSGQTVHATKGKVTKVDANTGVVTLAHDPVKSLNWPAMTMGFKVNDKMLLDTLGVGKTVNVEFIAADKGYVITSAK
jgi:Cu(I)/Ag(I) efflux system protein CusF